MALTLPAMTNDSGDRLSGTFVDQAFFQALFTAITNWPLDPYTPIWTGTGSNPVKNNGTVDGKYIEIGDLVIGGFSFTMGSTTTYGSGNYSMSLPVSASLTWPGIGLVWAGDASASGAIYSGFGLVFTTTTMLIVTKADPAANWTPTVPITFANGDTLRGMFVYLRA